MAYFLRQNKRAKGVYLQICETTYNRETRRSSNRSCRVLGYVEDLRKEHDDPIAYYGNLVREMNAALREERALKVSSSERPSRNVGYFLLRAMVNELGVRRDLDLMGAGAKFEKGVSDFVETMIYCQAIRPSSKARNAQDTIPYLYGAPGFSEDQIYRMVNFVGANYKKYIQLFNKHISDRFARSYGNLYFDCTNYYFEIDLAGDDRQKGPSKENRKEPIIGQALLLDGNRIPLNMEMYPGNKSERPYIRKLIEEMKEKANVGGRTIQVADKGLNCAQNIYAAAKEANDGYVFSKSVHGKNLSAAEKRWVLLEDGDANRWHEVRDARGALLYRYKSCVDEFGYEFAGPDGSKTSFRQLEKRVVSYNPALAKKQIAEINRQVDKAVKLNSIKGIKRSEYGDAVKYVDFSATAEGAEIVSSLNQDRIREDKAFAGYNLIVTSEVGLDAKEIYDIYHGLWRIEESFRILKSCLEARPVYLQTRESIYGHFLICYLSLLLLRLLEFYVFDNELSAFDLIRFMREFVVTKTGDSYLSNILDSPVLRKVKEKTQIATLDNLYLSERNLKRMLEFEF